MKKRSEWKNRSNIADFLDAYTRMLSVQQKGQIEWYSKSYYEMLGLVKWQIQFCKSNNLSLRELKRMLCEVVDLELIGNIQDFLKDTCSGNRDFRRNISSYIVGPLANVLKDIVSDTNVTYISKRQITKLNYLLHIFMKKKRYSPYAMVA